MSSHIFSIPPTSQLRVRAGPLAPALDGFADSLANEGYARSTIRVKLATARDLGGWIQHEGLAVESLDEQSVKAFLVTRAPLHRSKRGEAATGQQLLDSLHADGRISAAKPDPGSSSPYEGILDRYERCLVDERGLSQFTRRYYVRFVRAFLSRRPRGCAS